MINLRGHHLICLHFFHGKGYDEAFISNLAETMRRAREEPVRACSGADDVCAACVHLKNSLCSYGPEAEKEIQAMDEAALSLLGLSPGETATWAVLAARLPDIFNEWKAQFCGQCDWLAACEEDELFCRLAASAG